MTLHFPGENVECLDGSAPAWQDIVDNANILIVGNNNEMRVGKSLTACYTPGWGAFGLHLVIGTPFDHWMGTSRSANNCRLKIGKNVRIGSNNIIGCGSTVTKSIEGENQLAVGTPAKVVKTGVRWDGRAIKEYMKGTGRWNND